MLALIIFLLFFVLLIFSVPIAFCMLFAVFIYAIVGMGVSPTFIAQGMVSGSSSYIMLAIPMFILVGELMNTAGITRRMFNFADALVGHITGGLGHVNILASFLFGGMSGSAAADAGGLGKVEINAMKERGYDADFAVGVTAASSTIGPIIPPSIPMVIFGVTAGVSIGALFLGGIILGVLMGLFMMITVYIISKKRNYPKKKRASLPELWKAFKEAFWALLTPIILVGGIISGFFTPTEASVMAVIYSIILGLFIYKEIKLKDLLGVFLRTIETIGMVMLLLAAGTVFSWMLGAEKVAENVASMLLNQTTNIIFILILINVLLLIIGTFMETTASLLVMIPVLMPIITKIGMDPVQFGVIMVFVLMIGLLTPPVGICLFITSKIGEIPLERATKAVVPYYIGLIIVLILINVFPSLTLWLPSVLNN